MIVSVKGFKSQYNMVRRFPGPTVDDAIKGGLLPDSWTVTDQVGYVSVTEARNRNLPRIVHVAPVAGNRVTPAGAAGAGARPGVVVDDVAGTGQRRGHGRGDQCRG